eukprot:6173801-Prorocentrum_lima.AAC.1
MSRADIAAFVGHLLRHANDPRKRQSKIINRVLRYCKRVKSGKFFKKLAPIRMLVVADAAY